MNIRLSASSICLSRKMVGNESRLATGRKLEATTNLNFIKSVSKYCILWGHMYFLFFPLERHFPFHVRLLLLTLLNPCENPMEKKFQINSLDKPNQGIH